MHAIRTNVSPYCPEQYKCGSTFPGSPDETAICVVTLSASATVRVVSDAHRWKVPVVERNLPNGLTPTSSHGHFYRDETGTLLPRYHICVKYA